jgi:hypothetical protein
MGFSSNDYLKHDTEFHYLSLFPTYTICTLHYLDSISLHGKPYKHPSIYKITADTILMCHFSAGGTILGRCHTISPAAINIVTWHYVHCRKIYQQCSIKSAITFRISAFHPVSYTCSGDWEYLLLRVCPQQLFLTNSTHVLGHVESHMPARAFLCIFYITMASAANNHILPLTPNDAKNRATVLWIPCFYTLCWLSNFPSISFWY